MHATVQNSGNDYVTFKDATDLELDLDSPSLSIGYELTQDYFDRVAALHEEMTKKYMFALLKR